MVLVKTQLLSFFFSFSIQPALQRDLKMSSGALFPSLVSGSRGSSSKYLVEFRAGKMTLKGNVVTPDKRKGTVYIQQSDDSLIHFCWKDRTTGNVDDVSNFKLNNARGSLSDLVKTQCDRRCYYPQTYFTFIKYLKEYKGTGSTPWKKILLLFHIHSVFVHTSIFSYKQF